MKCRLNVAYFILKLLLTCTVGRVVGGEDRHTKGMMMDLDYLVSQLYLQKCTFVEIGEGVCSLFVELPLDTSKPCKRSLSKEMYFGNCLCSEFNKWQLCSRQLTSQRPEDCTFEEGSSQPSSSARVHRRLCDVTGMSQWNSQCNCSTPLAGNQQEPMCGFRTCYATPLPESICTPRTVCGTAHCDLSLHGTLYGVKCDRRCKGHQAFCEKPGPATTDKRSTTSEWTAWQAVAGGDQSNIQQYEAECYNTDHKPAFDCLGPGLYCCNHKESDCICEVKQDGGHLKAFRYEITYASSDALEHTAIKTRSAGFADQTKVWNRWFDMANTDSDYNNTGSLFNIGKNVKIKANGESKLISIKGFPPSLDAQVVEHTGSLVNGSGTSARENSTIAQLQNVTNEVIKTVRADSGSKISPTLNDVVFPMNVSKQNLKNQIIQTKQNDMLKKQKSEYHFKDQTINNTENETTTKGNEKSNLISLKNAKEGFEMVNQTSNLVSNSTSIVEALDHKSNPADIKSDSKLINMDQQNSTKNDIKKTQTISLTNVNETVVKNDQEVQDKSSQILKPIEQKASKEGSHVLNTIINAVEKDSPKSQNKIFQQDSKTLTNVEKLNETNKESGKNTDLKAKNAFNNKIVSYNQQNTTERTNEVKLINHYNTMNQQIKNISQEKLPQILNDKTPLDKQNILKSSMSSDNNKKQVSAVVSTQNPVFISDIDNFLPGLTSKLPTAQHASFLFKSRNIENNINPIAMGTPKSLSKGKKSKNQDIMFDQKDAVHDNTNLQPLLPDVGGNTKPQNQLFDEPELVLKDFDKAEHLSNLTAGSKKSTNQTMWEGKSEMDKVQQKHGPEDLSKTGNIT